MLGLMLAQPVLAEWIQTGQGSSATAYFDPATVRTTANGRRAWTMLSHRQPTTIGRMIYQSIKEVREFDCDGERVRTLQITFFPDPMGEGISLDTEDNPSSWRFPSPNSIGATQLAAVCKAPLK
jgi:hypothetical protein